MLFRHALDETLVENGVIGGAHGVGPMREYDLKLAGRIFGNQRARRKAHALCARIDVVEEAGKIFKVLHEAGLKMRRLETIGRGGGRRLAGERCFTIDEIEFKLNGDDGRQTLRSKAIDDAGERMTRVGRRGGAVALPGFHDELRGRHLMPGGVGERARDGVIGTI